MRLGPPLFCRGEELPPGVSIAGGSQAFQEVVGVAKEQRWLGIWGLSECGSSALLARQLACACWAFVDNGPSFSFVGAA